MNVRRVVMDVDKATQRPDLIELAAAVDRVPGVEAVNITINEIDMETVDMDITVEGDDIDVRRLVGAIEETGAVVHSIDQVATGSRIIEGIRRSR
ncbi:DUF211 domain-containing protein [Streptosporangium saharense]|uniref:DUF211 domain-containing protein n=1 Tax=Streptosporangium saharense TaxID=1706840 RepID=UPI0036C58FE8